MPVVRRPSEARPGLVIDGARWLLERGIAWGMDTLARE
jgi:hypothetical protein